MELFESMGMGTLDSYVADLEEALLSNTKDHYARKSQEWIETDSTPDYMIKVWTTGRTEEGGFLLEQKEEETSIFVVFI